MAPRIRSDDFEPSASVNEVNRSPLSVSNPSSQMWMGQGIYTASPATQGVIGDGLRFGHMRNDLPHGLVDMLDVTKMARLVEDHSLGGLHLMSERNGSLDQIRHTRGQPLVHIANSIGENLRLFCAEKFPVLLHGSSASRRIHENL